MELRRAFVRVKEHPVPANTSGLEDLSEQGGEVPSAGTSFSLMSAQMCGSGARAERVAMESVDRICLGRAPHMKDEYFLGSGVQYMGRALELF